MKFWSWIESNDSMANVFTGVALGLVMAGGAYFLHRDPERFLVSWALCAAFVTAVLWIDSKISWSPWNYVIEWRGNRPRIVRKD